MTMSASPIHLHYRDPVVYCDLTITEPIQFLRDQDHETEERPVVETMKSFRTEHINSIHSFYTFGEVF